MDNETFITRLNEASNSALKLAREFTFNSIADNLIFKIKPNSLDISDHLTDSEKEISKTIAGAYCPEKDVGDNPVLQIAKLIIFPKIGKIEIKRPDKFGGDLKIKDYDELEKLYASGKLHPADLKKAVAGYLEEIIAPIRKNYEK